VSEETGLVTFVSGNSIIRNTDTSTLRRLLLEAMEIPLVEREPAKAMKESDREITIG
jgi:hypothetical protein